MPWKVLMQVRDKEGETIAQSQRSGVLKLVMQQALTDAIVELDHKVIEEEMQVVLVAEYEGPKVGL